VTVCFTVKRSDKSREVDGAVNKVTWVTLHQNRKEIEASDQVSLCEKSLLLAFSEIVNREGGERERERERERGERKRAGLKKADVVGFGCIRRQKRSVFVCIDLLSVC